MNNDQPPYTVELVRAVLLARKNGFPGIVWLEHNHWYISYTHCDPKAGKMPCTPGALLATIEPYIPLLVTESFLPLLLKKKPPISEVRKTTYIKRRVK